MAKNKHARVTETELAAESGKSVRWIRLRESQGVIARSADGTFDRHLALTAILAHATGAGRPPKSRAAADPGEGAARKPVDWTTALKREQARKAKIERQELQGRLIRRSLVEATWAEQATMVRDQLLQLGPRLAGRLASETDPRVCSQLVTDEVMKYLTKLTGSPGDEAKGD